MYLAEILVYSLTAEETIFLVSALCFDFGIHFRDLEDLLYTDVNVSRHLCERKKRRGAILEDF